MSQFKTPKTKINDLELETQPKLNNFKPSIEIHKPEMLKLKEDADPQTGYSEYFQQSNNVNLKIIGNTVLESPSININSITGINLNAQTTVLGTVSADGYLVNGVPLARVTYTGNYLDLINTPVLIGSYAQLNNTSVQVWTGPQLFSQVQSSNVPKYSNDLITKSYADTTYSTKPATDYVLGGIRVPLTNNALSIASNGSLQTNVDNTTIFINNQNKLSVIYPSVTGVSSVSNRDGTINISGSRENPIISLNLDHTSVWTQDQNFTEDVSILGNLFVDSLIVQGSPLSKVAITGKYNDLLGKPNLTDVAYIIANNTWTGTNIFNSTTKVPTISGTTDNTTSAASTSFVQAVAALKAPLNSPAFTGIPTAPTAPVGTNTNQLATTAFANGVIPKSVAVQTSSSSDLMTRIIYPTDAYYNSVYSAGTQTGAICITLPTAIKSLNTMLKMTVNIYNNSSQANTSSICISGSWSSSTWNTTSATITSGSTAANFPISFGVNGSGVPCIYIGKVTSAWSAVMRVSIDNLLASYGGATIANLSSGWNIGIVTSITGLSTYSQEHIDDMISSGHSELPTLGATIVLNSNFTQAKGLYDIDAAGNALTVINSTGGKFMSGVTIQPDITYKRNSTFGKSMTMAQQLSSDLTYQQFTLSPVGSTATGGTGWARLSKYDADGLNPTHKQLFTMDPDTGVVGFSYIPTAPTAALGDDSTQLATTAFVKRAMLQMLEELNLIPAPESKDVAPTKTSERKKKV